MFLSFGTETATPNSNEKTMAMYFNYPAPVELGFPCFEQISSNWCHIQSLQTVLIGENTKNFDKEKQSSVF